MDVIETKRLILRAMTLDDLEFVAQMLGDAEVMRFYPKVCDRDEAREAIEKNLARYEQDGHGFWLATLRSTGEPIGRVGLLKQMIDEQPEDEIGYMIHRPYWRQGYATEAALAVRDYARNVLGKRRLISLVRPINIPSQRTALAIGSKPEKLSLHWNLEHIVFVQ